MATLTSFGFACRSCRPACRMKSGSCEALFHHGALGTAPHTTMSGVPASWKYGGPPGCPVASIPTCPRGLLLLMALAWSKWEGGDEWTGAGSRMQASPPLLSQAACAISCPSPSGLSFLFHHHACTRACRPFRGGGS